ncbi:MAG: TetR/AcrR family transcriptional regulator [Spirochaetes bacterium]|nr:TetR/AcrR family transcriptional regulator [Spirochaetota bacterium]
MPKIVDHALRRKEMAEVAIKTFAEYGFAKTTMQMIADKAEIAKGSLYKYFKTKEELLTFITIHFLQRFIENFNNSHLNDLEPLDKIKTHFYSVIEAIELHQDHFSVYLEIWMQNLSGFYEELKSIFENYMDQYRNLTANIIKEGQQKGYFKKNADSYSLAVYLIASLDGLLFHYLYNTETFDLKKVADHFFKIFCAGLLE